MQSHATLLDFADRLQYIIQTQSVTLSDHQFAELALQLFVLQCEFNEPYGKLCATHGISQTLGSQHWTHIPAVPTSTFKDLELSCLAPSNRTTVFHSSGTTQHRPSRHFHNAESLRVYEASLLAAFRRRLDVSNRPTIISLTPGRGSSPNSSLIYMFETFRERIGNDHSAFVGKVESDGWTLDGEIAKEAILRAAEFRKPVLILGTAFLYVYLLDYLSENDILVKLPPGSHIVETGGYKGRSRTLPKDELHQLICQQFGIVPDNIICEYGMSELSSQAYGQSNFNQVGTPSTASRSSHIQNSQEFQQSPSSPRLNPDAIEFSSRGSGSYNPEGIASSNPGLPGTSYPGFKPSNAHCPERVAPSSRDSTDQKTHCTSSPIDQIFHFPPWARVQIISPETGREVNEGETGLIRVYDLANVFSVMAIQTEDLGVRRKDGFELLGRASLAESRGCSLMTV